MKINTDLEVPYALVNEQKQQRPGDTPIFLEADKLILLTVMEFGIEKFVIFDPVIGQTLYEYLFINLFTRLTVKETHEIELKSCLKISNKCNLYQLSVTVSQKYYFILGIFINKNQDNTLCFRFKTSDVLYNIDSELFSFSSYFN